MKAAMRLSVLGLWLASGCAGSIPASATHWMADHAPQGSVACSPDLDLDGWVSCVVIVAELGGGEARTIRCPVDGWAKITGPSVGTHNISRCRPLR